MKKKIAKFLFVFSTICVLTAFYAFKIEPNLLIAQRIELEINENSQNEMTIVLFSDTHFKSDTSYIFMQRIVDKINVENPHIVMFLGDLIDDFSNNPVNSEQITQILSQINGQKLAIMGNHDYGGGAERTYKEIMENSGFNLLINESILINDVLITGIDDMIFGKPVYDISNEHENVLLMLHEGDMITDMTGHFDMAFSGHSHGGQIAIPFIKNLVMPSGSELFINGLYPNDKIFVTSGIGTTLIDARLFCIPEIVVVTLKY